ncbi:Thermophilic serine proteinase precursor [Nonomuraea coxensis DSM 45129]|uniref:Thermophilic serine proteinase n=1 Tax=Nonomuraea coxensis DSM 45129 TaxID=1122611 RepID=A0ABX8UC64_9ACTN|nr:Thermophilic serine proteinase precursor [Nonomuraea coxensis DSM 45129]
MYHLSAVLLLAVLTVLRPAPSPPAARGGAPDRDGGAAGPDRMRSLLAAALAAVCVVAVPASVTADHTTGPAAGPGVRAGGEAGAATSGEVGAMARAGQWQLGALRLPEAWRRSRGRGVLVAVLDTGVDARHPDLAGAVTEGPDLTGAARGHGPWGHHGTAMAALIAGRGHGPGRAAGIVGVAPEARVLSVRVTLESGDPQRERLPPDGHDALARGIRYAADHGAGVISMSLGGGSGSWEGSAAEEEAVRYALGKGAVLVASSGNDGESANRKNFPAAYPGVIAVGAVDRRLRVARFSNRQDYLSVVAPGTEIVTADGAGSYVVGDGTSSAAAMVAGIAALVRSARPGLSPYEVRTAIERGTRRRPASGYSRAYGHGVADALLALRAADGLRGADGPAAAAVPGAPGPGAHLGPGPAAPVPASRTAVIVGMLGLMAAMSVRVVTAAARRRRRDRDSP